MRNASRPGGGEGSYVDTCPRAGADESSPVPPRRAPSGELLCNPLAASRPLIYHGARRGGALAGNCCCPGGAAGAGDMSLWHQQPRPLAPLGTDLSSFPELPERGEVPGGVQDGTPRAASSRAPARGAEHLGWDLPQPREPRDWFPTGFPLVSLGRGVLPMGFTFRRAEPEAWLFAFPLPLIFPPAGAAPSWDHREGKADSERNPLATSCFLVCGDVENLLYSHPAGLFYSEHLAPVLPVPGTTE